MQQSLPGPGLGRGVLGKSAVGVLGTRHMLEKVLQMGALVVILRVCVVQNLSSIVDLRGRVSVARAVVGSRVSSGITICIFRTEEHRGCVKAMAGNVSVSVWRLQVFDCTESSPEMVGKVSTIRPVCHGRCRVQILYCVYQEFQARPPGLRKVRVYERLYVYSTGADALMTGPPDRTVPKLQGLHEASVCLQPHPRLLLQHGSLRINYLLSSIHWKNRPGCNMRRVPAAEVRFALLLFLLSCD